MVGLFKKHVVVSTLSCHFFFFLSNNCGMHGPSISIFNVIIWIFINLYNYCAMLLYISILNDCDIFQWLKNPKYVYLWAGTLTLVMKLREYLITSSKFDLLGDWGSTQQKSNQQSHCTLPMSKHFIIDRTTVYTSVSTK